jgi:membrane fusion protein (multidrug efflux system)
VAKVHAKLHQVVSAGTPLADIISNGPLKVRVNAPSRWLRSLRVGTDFMVTVDETGRRYPLKVSAISARVDPAAQTVEIEGRFASTFPELLPGMSGTAQFSGMR